MFLSYVKHISKPSTYYYASTEIKSRQTFLVMVQTKRYNLFRQGPAVSGNVGQAKPLQAEVLFRVSSTMRVMCDG